MKEELRILIIDDEAAIRHILRTNLALNGYRIGEAVTGTEGLKKTVEFHPHLILLDLGLPDMNGWDVLKSLRTWTQIPIIILTVSDDEQTKVKLLDAGANDYLTKPFGTNELLARVRVGLRGHNPMEATPVYKSRDLEINVSERTVHRNGKPIKLSNTEFEVLALLVRDQGRVVPQALILKKVWGTTAEDQSHYLRIYINQIRKKIEENPSDPKYIITEPGVGYRLIS